jgi:putative heme-binding domain-containing protein
MLDIAAEAKLPSMFPQAVLRIAASGTPEAVELLVHTLTVEQKPARQLVMLQEINKAFRGRRRVPEPASWPGAYAALKTNRDPQVASQLQTLAVTFGDAAALGSLRHVLSDKKAAVPLRKEALQSLVGARDSELIPVLKQLLGEPELRADGLRALAAYDDSQTPSDILGIYNSLSPSEKRDALTTLCSRVAYAQALLAAVGRGEVASTELSADLVRQLRGFKDTALAAKLNEVWGTVRDTPEETKQLIESYRKMLTAKPATPVDVALGRAVFAKNCQQCHTLFGAGAKVGPDLTGSNRANLDYLLSNVIDPSAVMAKEYRPSKIVTQDGRLITGIVKSQDANALTVQTQNEVLVVPRGDIELNEPSEKSMMPDGLLKPLGEHETRSLVAYLASPTQLPLLATGDNIAGIFNGKDLTFWSGDPSLWSVDGGEIVGRTAGLKHNEFLKSDLLLSDFHLTVEVKLVDDKGNSGIQFRSEVLSSGEVKGYQADVGVGWWGKLYEENGRALLWKESGEQHVKRGDWNTYEIIARGSHIKTAINGHACVDLDDPAGARRGIIALQLHSGGATEVRYRNFHVELNPAEK